MFDYIGQLTGASLNVMKAALSFVVGMVGVVMFRLAHRRALKRYRAKESRHPLLGVLFESTYMPLMAMIVLLAVSYFVRYLVLCFYPETFIGIGKSTAILMTVTGVWMCIRTINYANADSTIKQILIGKNFEPTNVNALVLFSKIFVIFLGLISVMVAMDVSMSLLVTFGGVGGLAVALAAQDMLANLFGGFMVFLDRPFSVGDWISLPENNVEGVVDEIGWRLTKILTFDRRPRYVPNRTFTTSIIENSTRMTHRRIKMHVGIRYEDFRHVEAITSQISDMLRTHDRIDHTQTQFAKLAELGDSAINILVYAVVKDTRSVDYYASRHDVLVRIMKIIDDNGASCAYPTMTVQVEKAVPVTSVD